MDAVVNRTVDVPTIKLDQAADFNLWALKAVLNGRGDEVIATTGKVTRDYPVELFKILWLSHTRKAESVPSKLSVM